MKRGDTEWISRLEALMRGYEELTGVVPVALLQHAKEAVRAAGMSDADEGEALLRVAMAFARAGDFQGAT